MAEKVTPSSPDKENTVTDQSSYELLEDDQRQRRRDRDEALTQLVRDAEEDGLYDADPEALRDAIKKARKERAKRRANDENGKLADEIERKIIRG